MSLLYWLIFLLIIDHISLFLDISLIFNLLLGIVDLTLLYVCTLLSFFKDLDFVLARSWVTCSSGRSFWSLFLKYFGEYLEWLYSRNSLPLFLRPGPSGVFTKWSKGSRRPLHSDFFYDLWKLFNSQLSLVASFLSSWSFTPTHIFEVSKDSRPPLCKFLKLFFWKLPSSQGLTLITPESLDCDFYLFSLATPLGCSWCPFPSPRSKICLQVKQTNKQTNKPS